MSGSNVNKSNTDNALEAHRRGYVPVPIRNGGKNPHISGWTHISYDDEDDVRARFDRWRDDEAASNVGLVLGEPSGGLIDIDLDHPRAARLRDYFLPPTPMRSGRPGRPISHFWYTCTTNLPGTRRYKMPDGSVSVELRSTGSQTLIPNSFHPTGEKYRWEGRPWGGRKGPAEVAGKVLSVQVALLATACVLIDNWPQRGGRHDAYLALAGGLLRLGDGVHPYWERNLPVLIRALAQATLDDDGPDTREAETMTTTVERIRSGKKVTGFPTLAEHIGNDHAELVRRMAREVESLAGFSITDLPTITDIAEKVEEQEVLVSTLPPEERDPLGERLGTWQPVDLDPYLMGSVHVPEPTVLRREDGQGLFYDGRVNSLYGQSEAAKSWVAMIACQQEMALGERVMYIDLEDEPTFTLARMRLLGIGDDDIRHQFTYVRPEDPHKDMQMNRWGSAQPTDVGRLNSDLFGAAMDRADPSLIIVDGMTVLYGLHGLDSNDAVSTDIITTWLKRLCRNGRSTVIVIDHTGKGAGRGSSPIGAHHKIAMVQGTAIQAHPSAQPRPGALGEIELIVFKDRPGGVRAASTPTSPAVAAVVELDSRVEGVTHVRIKVPDPDDISVGGTDEQVAAAAERAEKEQKKREALAELRDAIIEFVPPYADGTVSRSEIEDGVGTAANGFSVKAVVADLLEEGLLQKHSNNRWARYSRPQ